MSRVSGYNVRMRRCVLAVALCAVWVLPPAESGEARGQASGLSQQKADALARRLDELVRTARQEGQQPRRLVVTEAELNSFLNLGLQGGLPEGLDDLRVRMERDRLAASATVDIDRVKEHMPPLSPLNPLSFLSGRVPAQISGRLRTRDGFGSVELEEVRLGALSVPLTLVDQAVAYSTRTPQNPQGFDINAPFRLPYSIQRVRVRPGRTLIE